MNLRLNAPNNSQPPPSVARPTFEFTAILCGYCGAVFAVPVPMAKTLLKEGRDFWCPNGHCRKFEVTE